jgi:hypothetical protein
VAEATALAQSDALKSTMVGAGVEGPPQIWITLEA